MTEHQNPLDVQCCIAGGPAGVVLARLLARQGVEVALLEAHQDFNRDFRGDTVHPSTVSLLEHLGMLERLLQLPHATFIDFPVHYPDGRISPAPTSAPGKQPSVSYQIQQNLFRWRPERVWPTQTDH